MNDAGNHLRIWPPWGLRPVEQMLDDFLEDSRVQLVAHVLSVALGEHEVGVAEDAEVTRDGGPGGRESIGDLARGAWSAFEELEDLASRGVGECAEDGVHGWDRDQIIS